MDTKRYRRSAVHVVWISRILIILIGLPAGLLLPRSAVVVVAVALVVTILAEVLAYRVTSPEPPADNSAGSGQH